MDKKTGDEQVKKSKKQVVTGKKKMGRPRKDPKDLKANQKSLVEELGFEIKRNKGKTKAKRNGDGTFQKGTTGNKHGRPKSMGLTKRLRENLGKVMVGKDGKPILDKGGNAMTYEQGLIDRLMERGISKGDIKAIQLIFDRTEGKAKQSHEITGKNGDPIEHKLKVEAYMKEMLEFADRYGEDEEE